MRHETPSVHVDEIPAGPPIIHSAPTTLTTFVGVIPGFDQPALVHSHAGFRSRWPDRSALAAASEQFFANGGTTAWISPVPALTPDAVAAAIEGMHADSALVAIPADPVATPEVIGAATRAAASRHALLLAEGPWADSATAIRQVSRNPVAAIGASGPDVAVYWPRLVRTRPDGTDEEISPLGSAAGIIARTDGDYGVHRAPAGTRAVVHDIGAPVLEISDAEHASLNTAGVNAIRRFRGLGTALWGARTLAVDPDYRYVSVRRTALFLEESIARGLRWAAFEPNDESLWTRVRFAVEQFLHFLFLEGTIHGPNPQRAYFVRCDETTTTPTDVAEGRLNVVVGFAPIKPAEFVVLRITVHMSPT